MAGTLRDIRQIDAKPSATAISNMNLLCNTHIMPPDYFRDRSAIRWLLSYWQVCFLMATMFIDGATMRQSYHGLSPVPRRQFAHYSDVIMSAVASQITGVSIVYSNVCSGADHRKHQSSASLAFVRGIRR